MIAKPIYQKTSIQWLIFLIIIFFSYPSNSQNVFNQAGFSLDVRTLYSPFSTTTADLSITKTGSLHVARQKQLIYPVTSVSLGKDLFKFKNVLLDVKASYYARFGIQQGYSYINHFFPSLGLGIKYKSPIHKYQIELEAAKSFYTIERDYYLQEKGGLSIGLNVAYRTDLFSKQNGIKLGYQYMNQYMQMDLDKINLTSDPGWTGILHTTQFQHLILLGVFWQI